MDYSLCAVSFIATQPWSLSDVEFSSGSRCCSSSRPTPEEMTFMGRNETFLSVNSRWQPALWSRTVTRRRLMLVVIAVALATSLNACSTRPLMPYSEEGPPLVLVPVSHAGVEDKRGRFREIFCKVLEEHGASLPDYRPCAEALTQVGVEQGASGAAVDLGQERRPLVAVFVPGVGWDCFEEWLGASDSIAEHLRRFGYDQITIKVGGLSGSGRNARHIRDAIMQMAHHKGRPRLVLIGYSKGSTDILEALVSYPEIRPYIAAMVSAAGSVGGSALANDVKQSQLEMLRHWPGAKCLFATDGGAVESMRPAVRQQWLADNPLPAGIPYYSIVTFPKPGRISSVLKLSHGKLGRIDGRNDSQVLFYDQVIPGSTLVAYLNADHWAMAVPIARTHSFLGSTFVNRNDYPREALMEAVMRFVEEDLGEKGK